MQKVPYSVAGLKRWESLTHLDTKRFLFVVVMVMTMILGAVLVLGWMSFKKVGEIVTTDFNRQQLLLAQHAARQIENELNTLKKELSLLSLSPSLQYFETVWLKKRMEISFSRVKEGGTFEIRYIESAKPRTHLVDSNGYQTVAAYSEDLYYLEWARQTKNKGSILVSEVFPMTHGSEYQKLTMKMAVPVWQGSVDDLHPVATDKFSGVLIFVVDATTLNKKVIEGIASGKTGYAWIIDQNGTFLYHLEKDLIGKNAFEARKERNPTISFARINEIQKEFMLTGKEGTSWYISGWHRGREGEIKKLIAYSPVHVSDEKNLKWSVAVIAPISEVEDAIHAIHARQIILQIVIIIATLLGGGITIYLLLNWSHALEYEVERKTNEIAKSEQRYKSLIENAEDIIFTVDKDGNYLSINKYGAKFFSMKPADIIGRNIKDIILPPSSESFFEAVREIFNTKKGNQITHSIKIGDQEYWLNTNLRRLMDKEGNIYAILGISRDITSRKLIDETSYHTEKLASMGTLAAGVAHEINNPLGIILGFTDLLLEKAKPDSEESDILKTIGKHGLRAKRVVENLLSFARYTECKEELVDINKSIEDVIAVVGNTLLMKKISLKQNLSENLPKVKECAEELQQVFFNIINNAVFAMSGGGTLTIATRSLNNDELVEIRFADTGHGIRKEHRSRIFDPLFTTKKVGEGTGLGLSVSYGILTKHGGTIDFETKTKDESEETGTTFIITLPAIKQ